MYQKKKNALLKATRSINMMTEEIISYYLFQLSYLEQKYMENLYWLVKNANFPYIFVPNFDNTYPYSTNYYKFTDYTCNEAVANCNFIISVKLNTLTEHFSVLDAKDLFIQVKVYSQDINSEVIAFNIADLARSAYFSDNSWIVLT